MWNFGFSFSGSQLQTPSQWKPQIPFHLLTQPMQMSGSTTTCPDLKSPSLPMQPSLLAAGCSFFSLFCFILRRATTRKAEPQPASLPNLPCDGPIKVR